MGAEFLVKSALFCIFIFFCAKTSIIYVCEESYKYARHAGQGSQACKAEILYLNKKANHKLPMLTVG